MKTRVGAGRFSFIPNHRLMNEKSRGMFGKQRTNALHKLNKKKKY
jgi:hypothetical protein